jgi:hypothetical protein
MTGKPAQGRRSGQAGGEGSECGGGVAVAHASLIGGQGAKRNPQRQASKFEDDALPRRQ